MTSTLLTARTCSAAGESRPPLLPLDSIALRRRQRGDLAEAAAGHPKDPGAALARVVALGELNRRRHTSCADRGHRLERRLDVRTVDVLVLGDDTPDRGDQHRRRVPALDVVDALAMDASSAV